MIKVLLKKTLLVDNFKCLNIGSKFILKKENLKKSKKKSVKF